VVVTAVLAFIASRTRLGSGIFAVAGSFAHAWLCVLLYTFSVWALVVFILAAGVMYLYSRYRHQMLNADARKHAFIPLLGTSVLAMAVTLALTAGAFFGIVKPLNPPVLDITLITEVLSPEVLEVVGISTTEVVMDYDSYASNVDEDYDRDSDELNDQQQPDETTEDSQDAAPEDSAQTTEDLETNLDESIDTDSLGTRSVLDYPVLLVILACIAAFLVVMGIRRFVCRHKIWLKKLQKDYGREEQVRRMYHLFREKLAVIGISGSPYDAPVKQAKGLASKTMLMDDDGTTWVRLSGAFARMAYGGIPPTDEEYNRYISYYHHFWKACKKYCGFKWLWKKFRM